MIEVCSSQWPLISRYKASVQTELPKVELIDPLFKRMSEKEDEGIIRELLLDFYTSSGKIKPDQIIIFRDGVNESQFQVLCVEIDQNIKACKFEDEAWAPKFVVIVAQINHHTKFFLQGSPDTVQLGTLIDNRIFHPKNDDFYLCAHAGMIGTRRPTHYHPYKLKHVESTGGIFGHLTGGLSVSPLLFVHHPDSTSEWFDPHCTYRERMDIGSNGFLIEELDVVGTLPLSTWLVMRRGDTSDFIAYDFKSQRAIELHLQLDLPEDIILLSDAGLDTVR